MSTTTREATRTEQLISTILALANRMPTSEDALHGPAQHVVMLYEADAVRLAPFLTQPNHDARRLLLTAIALTGASAGNIDQAEAYARAAVAMADRALAELDEPNSPRCMRQECVRERDQVDGARERAEVAIRSHKTAAEERDEARRNADNLLTQRDEAREQTREARREAEAKEAELQGLRGDLKGLKEQVATLGAQLAEARDA